MLFADYAVLTAHEEQHPANHHYKQLPVGCGEEPIHIFRLNSDRQPLLGLRNQQMVWPSHINACQVLKEGLGPRQTDIEHQYVCLQGCVLSALSWTLYSKQERRLNTFPMRSLRRILGMEWSDRITNNEVLRRAATPCTYTMLR